MSDTNRMRELGRKGGLASAEARRRRKQRGWEDVLLDEIGADPETFAKRLLSPPTARRS